MPDFEDKSAIRSNTVPRKPLEGPVRDHLVLEKFVNPKPSLGRESSQDKSESQRADSRTTAVRRGYRAHRLGTAAYGWARASALQWHRARH